MLKKISNGFVKVFNKYLPDAFLFAVILTIIVFLLAMGVTHQTPLEMLGHWNDGFWNLLKFSMQMVLILVTGSAMASAPIFMKALKKMASVAKTPGQAIVLVTIVSIIACWINWGFGLIIGALFSKELAKQVKKVDYRLLIASAYTGFIVWHGGLSASIPLKLASGADLELMTGGAVLEAIPTSQTIFSGLNLFIIAALLIGLPLLNRAMHPNEKDVVSINPELIAIKENKDEVAVTPADKMERSKILWALISLMGLTVLVKYFWQNGFALNLNIVNFLFLFVGLILHGNLKKYLEAVMEAAKSASGIILQFPFYAGIMGMMTGKNADGASLAAAMSTMFVSISTVKTFPIFSFLSAGIVNFFVPSGGGQWAVQGPIMMPAGAELGVPAAKTAMAIAWGDAWTNMIQPFWALPALAIGGMSAKDIMGYCVMALIFGGVVCSAGFLIF